MYSEKIARATHYRELRERKRKSAQNAAIILELFQQKSKLISKLKQEVNEKWNSERAKKKK